MPMGYNIYRKLEDGEKLFVTSIKDREEAERMLASFDEQWPATYEIQEVNLPGRP